MRSVSVLFRILLLPIFLVRFCLPRPPEAGTGQMSTFGDGLRNGNSHLRQYVNDTHFMELVENKDGETMLNSDSVDFEQFGQDVRLSKIKMENMMQKHSTVKAVDNAAFSSNAKSLERIHTNRQLHLFRTKADLSGNQHDSQRTEPPKHKHKQTILRHLRHFKRSLSKDASKKTAEKANTLQDERLIQTNVSSLRHSTITSRENVIAGLRTKRGVDEESSSMRFEHTPSETTPPEYMVHLFQLLSGTQYESLRNFVVTGFVNVNEDKDFSMTSENVTTRSQKLVFDVHIPSETETIHYAELRLYFVHLGHETTDNDDSESTNRQEKTYQIRISENNELVDGEHRLFAEKTVSNVHNNWVSFNLTSSIQSWMNPGLRDLKISTVLCGNCTDSENNASCQDCSDGYINDLIVNLNHEQGKSPILVIFSRKSEIQMEIPHRREVRDTLSKKGHHPRLEENLKLSNKANDYNNSNASSVARYFQGVVEFISATSAGLSDNIQSSTFALLQDSVWSANAVNQPNATGEDNNEPKNNSNNTTFLKLKDIQPFTNNISNGQLSPQRQRTGTSKEARGGQKRLTFLNEHSVKTAPPEEDSSELLENMWRMRLRRDTKVRYRRHLDGLFKRGINSLFSRHKRETHNSVSRYKRSKKKRMSCQRNEMYVDFETIKWDKVIIFPRGYQAFECVGKCYIPISEYLTPTKHAIIQTLVHTSYPDQASRACCVPTKLDPISILYWDDNGDIKYDYTYEGMVVAECGCR